jgi:hypothetical protein
VKIEQAKAWPEFLGPAFIVGLVLAVYLGLILIRAGGNPLTFARLGDGFRNGQPIGQNEGYDGQFSYFLALDPRPSVVRQHLDVPAYRYQRILYPLLARLLALGQPALISWTLVAINFVAHIIGTYLVEQWLMMHNVSRWYALTYGLWAGLLMAVRLDLNEPVCYALIAGALLAHQRNHYWLSALCIGLALFAKETALLFWIAFLTYALLNKKLFLPNHPLTLSPPHLVTLSLSLLPFVLFQALLYYWFGSLGLTSGGYLATPFEIIPYMGLWRVGLVSLPALALLGAIFVPMVVLPSLWGIVAALRQLWQRDFSVAVCALAANAGFIPFTPSSTFREPLGLIRFTCGLVLATLFYGAHTKSSRVLNYSLLWLASLVFLLKE